CALAFTCAGRRPLLHSFPTRRSSDLTPGLEAFDAYMRDLMRKRGVRAGALAIAHDGRLVFAHGYTWGEAGYPITRPNSLFRAARDRKSTRLNSSHVSISYAVFCLKKK